MKSRTSRRLGILFYFDLIHELGARLLRGFQRIAGGQWHEQLLQGPDLGLRNQGREAVEVRRLQLGEELQRFLQGRGKGGAGQAVKDLELDCVLTCLM